jgi:hypothetical protein
MKHGTYSAYSRRNGCRCDLCRAAKAAYVRQSRKVAGMARVRAELAGKTYIRSGIAHGLSGYQNHACRCRVCVTVKADYDKRRKAAANARA